MNLTMLLDLSRLRLLLSKISLFGVLIVPLLITLYDTSQQVNFGAEVFQLLFVLVMLSETIQETKVLILENRYFKSLVVSIGFLYTGWLWKSIPIFEVYRTFHYPVYLLFFVAMTVWFRRYGDSAFLFISKIKIASTVFAMLYLLLFICLVLPPSNYIEANVFVNPPIYNHLRHMNYDMAFTIALILFGYCAGEGIKNNFYLILAVFCGYFTVWSAGRGQTLSFLLFLILLYYFKVSAAASKRIVAVITSLILGGVGVILAGDTFFMDLRNKMPATEDPVNTLSSDRVLLWGKVINTFVKNDGWWFGLGPDAWVRSRVILGSSQPHNFVLQWLFEFGLPVTVLLLVIMFRSVIFSLKLRNSSNDLTIEKMIAALMLSTFAYALVDGQFYHTIPFTMILIMAAYLFSQASSVRKTP